MRHSARALSRWALLALCCGVVVLAGSLVTNLRATALNSEHAQERLLDLRALVTSSDGLGWQLLAQGTPNFTYSQALRANDARAEADLIALQLRDAKNSELQRIAKLRTVFDAQVSEEQRLIAAHRLGPASQQMATGVDGTAELLHSSIEDLRARYAARSDSANARLYGGTLLALAISVALVALLAAAAAATRRRAAAAERRALESSERRHRALVHKTSEVVFVVDSERRITYVTDAIRERFGVPPETVLGRALETILPAAEQARARKLLDRAIQSGTDGKPSAWTVPHADGTVRMFETAADNFLHDPDVAGIVLTVRDVTARREMEAQLRHQALHDPLTGLANRNLFEDRVNQALQRLRRSGRVACVLYIDIDEFKAVNDSLGHSAGDELLQIVAGRVDACLRAVDTAARIGGDEFACLIEDLDHVDDVLPIARRILAELKPPITIEDRTIAVRASLGIAHSTEKPIRADELIRNADLAMYAAKAEAKGGLAVFHDALLTAARRRLDLREDLRQAIDRDELTVAYQPLVDLEGGRAVAIEALVRWQHPRDGVIGPDRFIPLAEESGVIVPLGRWVLDRALADLASWSEHAPELRVNVNVAPRELVEADYVRTVARLLERHAIAANRLTLELTESAIPNGGEISERLEELAQLGVTLAIDDFGTGQSSLSRLQGLPVSQVKVDRSFLSGIDEQSTNATLVRSMIELGHALGLQMVAEGIERESQLHALRPSLCPIGQGYLFGRPQSAASIAELLTQSEAKLLPSSAA